jgi:hypothetical protein
LRFSGNRRRYENAMPRVPVPGGKIIVTHALPALLVGLTALVTSGLVHAGYGVWWLSQHLLNANAPYDWTGALATSGTMTAVVLAAGLLMRRMVAGNAHPVAADQTAPRQGAPVPLAVPSDRA